jgi:hypothetical protein
MSITDYADLEARWHVDNFTTEGFSRLIADRAPSSSGR